MIFIVEFFGDGGYYVPDNGYKSEIEEKISNSEKQIISQPSTSPLTNKNNEANPLSFFAPSKKSRNLGYRAAARMLVHSLR